MTGYRFTKGCAWPMKTACSGDCLNKWPVVALVSKNSVKGVTKKGFAVFDRPGGAEQQTIDCRPLYSFSGDTERDDANGREAGGTWFAFSSGCELVEASK